MFDMTRRLIAGITVILILGLAYVSAAPRARHPLSLMREFDVAAAVAFDGKAEILIVTAKLTSDKVRDLTWVVPIRSDQKPVVELVKADVLHEMYWILQGFDSRQVWSGGDMGGEALVSRLLDMRDPQIYSADVVGPGTAALEDWLRGHGVRQEATPESSGPNQTPQDTFFVVVHVGLANLYEEDVDYG